jgi:hypothetical protein
MESVIGINIYNNENIINKFPILFYWNNYEDVNLINKLKEMNEFQEFFTKNIKTLDSYLNTTIYLCYYNDETENHIEQEINLNKLFSLDYFDNIWIEDACECLSQIYVTSFKNDVEYTNKDVGLILFIYNKLKQKYQNNRINKIVVTNYVLSKLSDKYTEKLSIENLDIIKNKLMDILE